MGGQRVGGIGGRVLGRWWGDRGLEEGWRRVGVGLGRGDTGQVLF